MCRSPSGGKRPRREASSSRSRPRPRSSCWVFPPCRTSPPPTPGWETRGSSRPSISSWLPSPFVFSSRHPSVPTCRDALMVGKSSPCEHVRDEGLRLLLDPAKVVLPQEALGVDLVDVLRARRPRGEPPVFGHDFQPADGTSVARGVRKDFPDLLPCQFGRLDLARRQPGEDRL